LTQTASLAVFDFSAQRRAGILLHPTSLPGRTESGFNDHGDMGQSAYRFIEFLAAAGMSVWQMLPLGPTHEDNSPYQCLSVHAGNPELISLDWLQDRGWLDKEIFQATPHGHHFRTTCLKAAYSKFEARADHPQQQAFSDFCESHKDWLDDFSLFMAIKQELQGTSWVNWPAALRKREDQALNEARQRLENKIKQVCFEQYVFFSQWFEMKEFAHQHGVYLFGDMPIFVAHDSADVWSRQDNFLLNEDGQAEVVAGVPPDYFSATGQRWGNPLYDWEKMQADGFQWWIERMHTQLELCDVIRIDHFRGFEAYWEIPATAETAIEGQWVKAPGQALLTKLYETFSGLPLVAEDLGVITKEVTALRESFHLPGMKILQFAFGGDETNPYLPPNHEVCSVVYTGTHDNDTSLSWYNLSSDGIKKEIDAYSVDKSAQDMPWPLIEMAMASVANMAIIPMQDVLALGAGHRTNTPGTTENNWGWRFEWQQLPEGLAERLKELLRRYHRLAE